MEHISSTQNPLVKRARSLAERKGRRKAGAFLVEGQQPVWRAVESGWSIEALIHAPGLAQSPQTRHMVADLDAQGVRVVEVTDDVFARLSERDGPTGVAAVVGLPAQRGLDSLELGPQDLVVVLHRVSNPGNLGTILRTADAVGARAVIGLDECADPFAPTAVKASMGSLFNVLWLTASSDDFLTWAPEHVTTYAASGYAAESFWETIYDSPAALLLGNEGAGLPERLLRAADHRVAIPMTGTAESLNLSVAASVLMYEARRGRIGLAGPGGEGHLSERRTAPAPKEPTTA